MSAPSAADSSIPDPQLTREDLALLRASVAFHTRHLTDPVLRTRLELALAKLTLMAAAPRAA